MKRSAGRKKKPTELRLPPHINAEPHRQLMKRLAKMTPEEFVQTLIKSGIVTKSGKLRKPYAPQPDDPV